MTDLSIILDQEAITLEDPDEEHQFQERQQEQNQLELRQEPHLVIKPGEILQGAEGEELEEINNIPSHEILQSLLSHLNSFNQEKEQRRHARNLKQNVLQLVILCEKHYADWRQVKEQIYKEEAT